MDITVAHEIAIRKDITPTDKLVLALAHTTGGKVSATAEIANLVGANLRTVYRSLGRLSALGLLSWESEIKGDGRYRGPLKVGRGNSTPLGS